MTLPNFLIIGSQKSGSTWLARNLGQHPDIFLYAKEIHFFNNSENFSKGIEWYKSHFLDVTNEKLVGEKTPNYFDDDLSRRRIFDNLPEAKLIVILRNPIQRAISAVNHYKNNGSLSPYLNLDNVFQGILQKKPEQLSLEDKFGFLRKGYYFQHLKDYLEYFNSENFLILFYEEDIVQDPHKGLKKTCDFLDCNYHRDFFLGKISQKINRQRKSSLRIFLDFYLPKTKGLNQKLASYFPNRALSKSLNKTTLSLLNRHYSSHNKDLFKYIGYEIETWG